MRLPVTQTDHGGPHFALVAVFSGLWLAPAALIRGEMASVMAVLQEGLASSEHTEFAARLQASS